MLLVSFLAANIWPRFSILGCGKQRDMYSSGIISDLVSQIQDSAYHAGPEMYINKDGCNKRGYIF